MKDARPRLITYILALSMAAGLFYGMWSENYVWALPGIFLLFCYDQGLSRFKGQSAWNGPKIWSIGLFRGSSLIATHKADRLHWQYFSKQADKIEAEQVIALNAVERWCLVFRKDSFGKWFKSADIRDWHGISELKSKVSSESANLLDLLQVIHANSPITLTEVFSRFEKATGREPGSSELWEEYQAATARGEKGGVTAVPAENQN